MPKQLPPARKFVKTLDKLVNDYPNQELSLHLGMMFADYPSIDALSDTQLLHIIEKYKCEKEMDYQQPSDIDEIVKDAMDLDHILDEDGDDEEY